MRADGFTWSIYCSELSLSAEQALLYWMSNLFPPAYEFFTIGWVSGKHDNTSILGFGKGCWLHVGYILSFASF